MPRGWRGLYGPCVESAIGGGRSVGGEAVSAGEGLAPRAVRLLGCRAKGAVGETQKPAGRGCGVVERPRPIGSGCRSRSSLCSNGQGVLSADKCSRRRPLGGRRTCGPQGQLVKYPCCAAQVDRPGLGAGPIPVGTDIATLEFQGLAQAHPGLVGKADEERHWSRPPSDHRSSISYHAIRDRADRYGHSGSWMGRRGGKAGWPSQEGVRLALGL